jgi:hypothetical protein
MLGSERMFIGGVLSKLRDNTVYDLLFDPAADVLFQLIR